MTVPIIRNNLKIGYDNNGDDDIDDAGDDVVIDEVFTSTSITTTYDKAGNLIDDGRYQYIYDAWNRLIKIRSSEDTDRVFQTAEFDATGRRIKKVVTNSGQHDKTEVYLYDGQKIIETRDGSNNMVQQFIHGTQYIDELVMVRVKDKGELYIHQDANWNVIATTDMGGHVVERNIYAPYGEVVVNADSAYGDRDGDGDVDSTDKGTPGTTCTGTVSGACRIFDLDFDGDYDSTDATKFDNLPQGLARHPGMPATATDQPFAHQGLLFEPEVGQYQNRARQYDPGMRRFVQRDPARYVDGLNLYRYVVNNPISLLDAFGLWFESTSFIFLDPSQNPPTTPVASITVEFEKDGPPPGDTTTITITITSIGSGTPESQIRVICQGDPNFSGVSPDSCTIDDPPGGPVTATIQVHVEDPPDFDGSFGGGGTFSGSLNPSPSRSVRIRWGGQTCGPQCDCWITASQI